MKKLLLLLCLTVFTFGYSQEKTVIDFPKNEIKGNALFLVAGALEVTYEHLINEESGIGVSLFVPYVSDVSEKFNLTPFYRFYFGKKPAAGFFVEGFGMLNSYKYFTYNGMDYSNGLPLGLMYNDKVNRTDFALGFGLGAKWVTRKGFLFEINGGVGRNLFNSSDTDYQIVGRGGITLGYRF
ncbi:MAG: DUF3575 domain-containing protein [Flavobacterium sp.]|uniref:DUF3575 domain-containing protein n=1 Tax=Flavobacterium sp. TaxID=239 RepID=UPI00260C2BA5|nr:DUF3575 domain-containing protein [Flavobacterium sp.]MDD5149424.1 DUF3575 domain-containing protein [Flavobacterium sp.]